MEKSALRGNNNSGSTSNAHRTEVDGSLRTRSAETSSRQATTIPSDCVLQWGNRKRLRCMKVHVKDESTAAPVNRTTVRVDRRVIRADKETSNLPNTIVNTTQDNRYFNLRRRPSSPPPPPPPLSHQRVLRYRIHGLNFLEVFLHNKKNNDPALYAIAFSLLYFVELAGGVGLSEMVRLGRVGPAHKAIWVVFVVWFRSEALPHCLRTRVTICSPPIHPICEIPFFQSTVYNL
uniref:Uncharacterized protein MANES_03G046400 n=1 Tax=Rhizophora mucronata TaxID=61149 RepID=A0A2P2K4A8_RHIMU